MKKRSIAIVVPSLIMLFGMGHWSGHRFVESSRPNCNVFIPAQDTIQNESGSLARRFPEGQHGSLLRPNPTLTIAPDTSNNAATVTTSQGAAYEPQIVTSPSVENSTSQTNAWINTHIVGDKSFNISAKMDSYFLEEQSDPSWATEQEDAFLDLFFENPALADFSLIDVQCKATQCRLSVASLNTEYSNIITTSLSNALPVNGQAQTLFANPQQDNYETIVYVSRKGETFSFMK